jgi:uncharacterized damage-inducible protein DinB
VHQDPLIRYLQELCRYNVWANEKFSVFIIEAGEEKCLMIQESSFQTIRDTLVHIWDAQHIWLERLQGRSPDAWPGMNFTGTTQQIAAELVKSSAKWELFVGGIEPGQVNSVVVYKNIRGQEFTSTVGQIVAHVMNHGTFHRGQIVTMLRVAGYKELKQTDLIAFFRLSGNES